MRFLLAWKTSSVAFDMNASISRFRQAFFGEKPTKQTLCSYRQCIIQFE